MLCAFFQDAKSSLTKHKKCFWKPLMEAVKYLSWNFLQKLLTFYSRKQFPSKIPPSKFERVLKNTNSYFDESYSPKYKQPHKSTDLMQNASPLFYKPLTPLYN